MVNKVILIGNLGADPEVRNTNSGSQVANLRIATTERQKDREGNWVDHTEWHRVVCFGKTAENVERFLSKGRQVYIEGRLRTAKWTDKDGVERYTTEIVADTVRFLGGGRSEDSQAGGDRGTSSRVSKSSGRSGGGSYDNQRSSGPPDDDIPF